MAQCSGSKIASLSLRDPSREKRESHSLPQMVNLQGQPIRAMYATLSRIRLHATLSHIRRLHATYTTLEES